MLKALIVDDEAASRESLLSKLRLFTPEVEVIGQAESVSEALEMIQQNTPDVLFLDVNLSGETGFELLEKLEATTDESDVRPEVIFITAHDEFAIKAIKFSALDYLLKPIDPEELVSSIRKLEERKGLGGAAGLGVLVENLRGRGGMPKRIVVPTYDGMHILKITDIVRCESSSNYTNFILLDAKPILASKTLKEYDNMLSAHRFERIHKSHLINMDYVKRYVPADGGYMIMVDGSRIPVANRKKEQLLKMIRNM
jgi:two-component system, LytTR family, response regulator